MKGGRWMTGLGLLAWWMGVAMAQVQEQAPPLPKTPTSFETRNTSGTEEVEVSMEKKEGKTTKVTLIAVTESRDWKDTQGKVIRGRLLAFEAATAEDAHLVRDGKVRLLVDGAKRFNLLPLIKLSAEDRAHIGMVAATRKQEASLQKSNDPK